ncbi:MAG TPA: hypothetical protein VN154_07960 [Rhizomicrobium sp.]|nr:hypothetical protein [Rhizomicrobium sp.]
MILRALFWISLVAMMVPREPDLGLGRPGHHGIGTYDCNARGACTDALGFFAHFQSLAVQNLAQVKDDIARERHHLREN